MYLFIYNKRLPSNITLGYVQNVETASAKKMKITFLCFRYIKKNNKKSLTMAYEPLFSDIFYLLKKSPLMGLKPTNMKSTTDLEPGT